MAKNTKGLGRGLSGLIAQGGAQQEAPKKEGKVAKVSKVEAKQEGLLGFEEISVSKVEANPHQPRMEFKEEELKELSASIKQDGLLQPVVVRKVGSKYQLIAGERRWRASKLAGLKVIPARILEASDTQSAVISLVENLQREDLNPIDEAMGYASLMRDFDMTQEAVAKKLGKPRATIANFLRLVNLEQEIQGFLAKGTLSMGHAKVLMGMKPGVERINVARKILEMGLSVRETERYVLNLNKAKAAATMPKPTQNMAQAAVIKDLQKQLGIFFNRPVDIKHGAKKGKLVINYNGDADLNRILEKIGYLSQEKKSVA